MKTKLILRYTKILISYLTQNTVGFHEKDGPLLKVYSKIITVEFTNLTAIEVPRLRVLENKVLRRIFGTKRNEVTGEWRKLHNEELNDLYSSPIIVRVRWAGHVARMGKKRGIYKVLVGKPKGKRPLGRPERR